MIFACVPDIDSAHISYGIRATGTYSAEGALIMTSASIASDSNTQVSDMVDITRKGNDATVIKETPDIVLGASNVANAGSAGGLGSAEASPDDEELRLVMKEAYEDLKDVAYETEDGDGSADQSMEKADTTGDSYTVVQGNCLWNIAKARYGSGIDYIKIYEANRNVIGDDPNLIFPGTVLVLP